MHPLVRQMSERMLGTDTSRGKEYRKNHCSYFLHYTEAHSKNPGDLIQERDELWLAMVQTIQVGWKDEKLPVFLGYISRPFWDHMAAHEFEAGFWYLFASNLINVDNLGCSRELVEILTPLLTNKTRIEDKGSLSYVLKSLGGAYTNLGEYRKAIELFEQSLEINRRIGDVWNEGVVLGSIGSLHTIMRVPQGH